jgi:hypothetical protein
VRNDRIRRFGRRAAFWQEAVSDGPDRPVSAQPVSHFPSHQPLRILFLLQEPRRLLAQCWEKVFRCLRQEPRQRHFDAQRVLQHFDTRRRSLAKRAHSEPQRISFPRRLLHRNHGSELTVGAGETLFQTADRLTFSETMADDDGDGIAHWECNSAARTYSLLF